MSIVPGKNGFARSLPKAFSFGKTIQSIFPFSILCSDDCRLCEFHCCGSRVCSNKIVLGFYLVEFIDSAVLVIEFMAPPTIQSNPKSKRWRRHLLIMLSSNSGPLVFRL